MMVAESSTDQECKPITASMVKHVLVKELNMMFISHWIITVLGHMQRGGNPSAYDHVLVSRMWTEASIIISEAKRSIGLY